ncbi:phage tail protein [Cohnella fermenti]|uniref:Uncharacterized protein n=1 Tax=Cohnella fermenti TaxID=2565925 RepID=A0A4V3WGB9_9BACL|nr:phage tail protein [Cohnella fermenti]THF83723.1 hypothetical protein E6C55_03260 [Cohnella fermenti]
MKVKGLSAAKRDIKKMRDQMQAAASTALNRVGKGVMTEASSKVRETYNIKDQDVKAAFSPLYSAPGAGEVRIKAKGSNLPLLHYKLTPKAPNPRKPKAVTVAVRRGEKKRLKTAYLHPGSGRLRVLKRQKPTGQSGRRRVRNEEGDYPELPIEEIHGPAVPRMLNEPQVIKHIEEQAGERMLKQLDHEIKRILR